MSSFLCPCFLCRVQISSLLLISSVSQFGPQLHFHTCLQLNQAQLQASLISSLQYLHCFSQGVTILKVILCSFTWRVKTYLDFNCIPSSLKSLSLIHFYSFIIFFSFLLTFLSSFLTTVLPKTISPSLLQLPPSPPMLPPPLVLRSALTRRA